MGVEVTKDINSVECIRCGKCKEVCPKGAVTPVYPLSDSTSKKQKL